MFLRAFLYLILISLLAPVTGQQKAVMVPDPEVETAIAGRESPTSIIGLSAYRELLVSGRYIVGPEDRFLMHITGMEAPGYGEVLSEGGLFIPKVGLVQVAGDRLENARRKVQMAYKRIHREGEISLQLYRARRFPVSVVGAIAQPKVITASGLDRVSQVVARAVGLGDKSSRRNIRILNTASMGELDWQRVRDAVRLGDYELIEKHSGKVDLQLLGVTGDYRYDPFVEDGDMIFVPAKLGQVAVRGPVARPGFYEFVAGDRVSDLMTLAGGPLPYHDSQTAQLFRYNEDRTEMLPFSLDIRGALERNPQADVALHVGDWIVLREIPDYEEDHLVFVEGEVIRPGYHVIGRGQTRLVDLIAATGGFTDDAFLPGASLRRAPSAVDLEDPEFNRITDIPVADRELEENQYYLMKIREKVGRMVVNFQELFLNGDLSHNHLLKPGDQIVVPSKRNTVVVSGQAANPGVLPYQANFSAWDYIGRAGGFGWRASKDVVVIKADTGERKRAEDVNNIEPGDRIWIKESPDVDYWKFFTEGMGVVGQVSTLVLVFISLTK